MFKLDSLNKYGAQIAQNKSAEKPKKSYESSQNTDATPATVVSSEVAMATLGIQKSPSFGGKNRTKDSVNIYVNSLPFARELTFEDKKNLAMVIRKKGVEAEYMKKMIELVCSKKVDACATTSLCKHGQMSELAKNDIDIYYDKINDKKMSVKDAFVPLHASQDDGQKASQVGDVFRVGEEESVYVKTGDNSSKQLKIDADTYLKLFPPVERFASSQGGTGDCYLLSSINSIMENPYARLTIYDCFTQKGKDVEVSLPNGLAKAICPDAKLPSSADISKYTSGPVGMKLLEHVYGKEFEAQKYDEYKQVMADEYEKLDKQLAKWEKKRPQDHLALKKQKEITTRIENWHQGQTKVDEAMKDPNHKLTFVLDDYDNFITGKFGPMVDDCDKIDAEYKSPAEFYTGGVGGYSDVATSNFGFNSKSYLISENSREIDKALFAKNPYDYIISAGTPPEEAGMESDVDTSYSIYSSHAYKILPFDDENGTRMFKVTNPWNQSHRVIMDETKLKFFFEEFAIAKVNDTKNA